MHRTGMFGGGDYLHKLISKESKRRSIKSMITDYRLNSTYDVVFSTGSLQYLPRKMRDSCFQNYKDSTSYSGVNAISVFVRKPFIAKAPDA